METLIFLTWSLRHDVVPGAVFLFLRMENDGVASLNAASGGPGFTRRVVVSLH